MNGVDHAIGGDRQALEELLADVQDMVYNLSLRMLGSPHDAEDAAQEIYIRIVTGLSTFKKESAFSTWLAGFLKQYCGLASSEKCSCKKRIGYAVRSRRLNPNQLEYSRLEQTDPAMILDYAQAMEEMDTLSLIFAELPAYRSSQAARDFMQEILKSKHMATIQAQV